MQTIRVRIAVAVSADGEWQAVGWSDNNPRYDDRACDHAMRDLDSDSNIRAFHFVEAEIPLPVATTVEGRVTA